MAHDKLTAGQQARIELAAAVTREMLELAEDLVVAAGMGLTDANRLAMLQALATNYLAETTRTS
ncbi:hypothetical protein [Roseateles puraquae]|uniref:hypothetical protein n=1 Tax=Roseateles puraquae TaxID=431059 RepID=UPI0031D031AF